MKSTDRKVRERRGPKGDAASAFDPWAGGAATTPGRVKPSRATTSQAAQDKKDGGGSADARVVRIGVDQIDVPEDDRREVRNIDELAASIGAVGQLAPILVTPDDGAGRFRLVAGQRRLEACKKRGDAAVCCKVLELEGAKAELAGLDENLQRQELTVLERADCLVRRQKIYEGLYPEARRPKGGRRKNGEIISSFAADSAAKADVTQRTVQQELQIGKKLTAATKKVVRGTRLENKKVQLLRLAGMEPKEQVEAAKRMVIGKKKGAGKAAPPGREDDGPDFTFDDLRNGLQHADNILARNLEGAEALVPTLTEAQRGELEEASGRIRGRIDGFHALLAAPPAAAPATAPA